MVDRECAVEKDLQSEQQKMNNQDVVIAAKPRRIIVLRFRYQWNRKTIIYKARQELIPAGLFVENRLSVSAPGSGYSLAPQRFTLFAASVLAGFLIAFFKLQPFEQPVILNFFLQNAHGFLKVIVVNFYLNCFQTSSPPLVPSTLT